MTLTVSQISALAGRFGNKIITAQVNHSVPFLGSGALRREPMKGKVATINVFGGGLDSTTLIADGAALSSGSSVTPTQATQTPAALFSRLSIGRVAAYVASGADDAADIVKVQIENCGKDIARNAGRNIFDASLGSPNGAVAFAGTPAAVTLAFTDVSGFRVGQAVNFVDVSASISYTLQVTAVSPAAVGSNSANVAGNVTLKNTVTGVAGTTGHDDATLDALTVATNDLFALRGAYPGTGAASTSTLSGNALVSYADIASASASLHGIAATTAGLDWVGNTASSFGVMSAEGLTAFAQRIFTRSMADFTHLVMSPAASVAYATAQISASSAFGLGTNQAGQARRNIDGKFDKFGAYKGSGLSFLGKPVILDPNCPATNAVLHNDEVVTLGIWRDFEPDADGKEAAMVDRSNFNYDMQFVGLVNPVCHQRNAVGLITGITNL